MPITIRPEGDDLPSEPGRPARDYLLGIRRQYNGCIVLVTNLSENLVDGDIQDLFGTAGRIRRLYVPKHRNTSKCKGYAFVTYDSKQTAEKAVAALHKYAYGHLILNVEIIDQSTKFKPRSFARRSSNRNKPKKKERKRLRDEGCTVRVTNLSENVVRGDIKDLFGTVGRITRLSMAKDENTLKCEGYAFVTYESKQTAEKAVAVFNKFEYDHLILNVKIFDQSTTSKWRRNSNCNETIDQTNESET